MATAWSSKLAGKECWCGGLKPGSGDRCSCVRKGRSIYLDRSVVPGDESGCCSMKAKSCDVRGTSWHGLYVDNGEGDLPELESARRNNSTESRAMSLSEHASVRGQDTSSTTTVGGDAETSFLRSGADSVASNNVVEEDGASSGSKGPGCAGLHCWEDARTRNEVLNKSLKGKHKPERLQRRRGGGRDLRGPSSSQNKLSAGVQAEKSNQTLISSLEHAIALLGLSLGDASQLVDINSLVARKLEQKAFMDAPETELTPESSQGSSRGADLWGDGPNMSAPTTPLNFPTPCTMQSTYNEPFISPLATEQEYRSTITDYIHGSDSAQGSLDTSHVVGWRSSKMTFPSVHSSRKSQIYCPRSTEGGGVQSVSMSDWDIYEAGIHVKQTPNFSDSDGVFEEFVRDQESYFTPPLVLAGDAWDPTDRGNPFDCIFSDNHRPYAANEPMQPEINPLQPDSPFIPAIQDVGVQVYSRELESRSKSTLLERVYGKSSELRAKLLMALKSRRLRPWLASKDGLRTEPLPTTNAKEWDQVSLQRQSSHGSDSVKTMVSIMAEGCGFQAQLKRLIPRRFTDSVPRNELLTVGAGNNCQSGPDSSNIYCHEPASNGYRLPQLEDARLRHSIRETPHPGVDLTHDEVGKQLRRIWT